eukprot:317432_1
MGRYFSYFASIGQLIMIVYPQKIDGPMAADGCYEGTEYKNKKGKVPKGWGKTFLYRAIGLLYTQKMGHIRRTKFGGVESYANYGEWLQNVGKQSEKLYLDGVGLTRSILLGLYYNTSWCIHKNAEWTKYSTLKRDRLNRTTVNLVEYHWNEDRLLRRIRHGCGPRNGGAENRQLWQDMLDWKHCFTDRTAPDMATTFFHQFSLLFAVKW